jgi:hypothetical protein
MVAPTKFHLIRQKSEIFDTFPARGRLGGSKPPPYAKKSGAEKNHPAAICSGVVGINLQFDLQTVIGYK